GSESSWDKDKLQSPITTGSQHSIGHPTLSGQSSLGSAHPLSPLQQNHLLTNRIDLPFMMMPHPLLPVSLPPASVAMAMNQMNHLNTIANMAAAAQMHSPLSRAGASVIKERIQDSPSPAPSLEDSQRPGSHASSHQSSSVSSSPSQLDNTPDRIAMLTNSREGELIDQETGTSLKKIQKEKVRGSKGRSDVCPVVIVLWAVKCLLDSPCREGVGYWRTQMCWCTQVHNSAVSTIREGGLASSQLSLQTWVPGLCPQGTTYPKAVPASKGSGVVQPGRAVLRCSPRGIRVSEMGFSSVGAWLPVLLSRLLRADWLGSYMALRRVIRTHPG
ncbi:PREDICTED: dachshund homolog 2-like, partial [Mesitornis unicolor]|uniref:dachshund homolog 2-like n=1 Tax=Mesitornis unicolor TaxID=54374 RepID=UPI000528C617